MTHFSNKLLLTFYVDSGENIFIPFCSQNENGFGASAINSGKMLGRGTFKMAEE